MSAVYCGYCAVSHERDAPHCGVCSLLLAAPADVEVGMHAGCRAHRERQAGIAARFGYCSGCGTTTNGWADEQRRVCTFCGRREAEQDMERRFKALEAAGRSAPARPAPVSPPQEPPSEASTAISAANEKPPEATSPDTESAFRVDAAGRVRPVRYATSGTGKDTR